jgi:cytochrome P450
VCVVHGKDDARALRQRLAAKPRQVLVIGAGFVGSQVASVFRMLELDVAVVKAGPAPLSGALGATIGAVFADVQHDEGVDLRCGVTVAALDDDSEGRLSLAEIGQLGEALFVAGYEMLINLTSNTLLTLLRNPEVLEQARRTPSFRPRVVEEVMRNEPPIQMVVRIPLTDIVVAGSTIPAGANAILLVAAANRDSDCFDTAERFNPLRFDNQHLGMGGGIHYCFGAPLARLSSDIALGRRLDRLHGIRLVSDPPPYRDIPLERGPRALLIDVASVS